MKFFMLFLLPIFVIAESVDIIPKPVKIEISSGNFLVCNGITLAVSDKKLRNEAGFLEECLKPLSLRKKVAEKVSKGVFLKLTKNDRDIGDEGYRLNVTKNGAVISANSRIGIFNGLQTFRQLLPVSVYSTELTSVKSFSIPCVKIVDYPRFSWRGGHFDVGRHFMPKEFIKKYIDLLAMHKFNKLHWHLTEDQGWRIEIKKYPKLTEIGSKRKETAVSFRGKPIPKDGKPHVGFYTQDDIREIVAYAKKRHVTIVPEIEFPGHCLGAIAAYPELGCLADTEGHPVQHEVWTQWGVSKNICNPSDKTVSFFKDVFKEVAELFPGEYFHIGGDEAPLDQWKSNPIAQKKMKEHGFHDVHQLQSLILNDLVSYLETLGKRGVAWSDILHRDLSSKTVIMPYHGNGKGGMLKALANNHQVVMCPTRPTYFDYISPDDGFRTIGYGNPIDQVYNFEPVLAGVPKDKEHLIIGSQFHCWTEMMPTSEVVERRVYPRACAMSEVLWTPRESKNFSDFSSRLKKHKKRLVNYGVIMIYQPDPIAEWNSDVLRKSKVLEWDVSDEFQKPETFKLKFIWNSGKHGVDIKSVKLLASGKVVAEDVHDGFAGGRPQNDTYVLKLNQQIKGKLLLQVEMQGNGGNESWGHIIFSK